MHNFPSETSTQTIYKDLWDTLNLHNCEHWKTCAFIFSLIVIQVCAIWGEGHKIKAFEKGNKLQILVFCLNKCISFYRIWKHWPASLFPWSINLKYFTAGFFFVIQLKHSRYDLKEIWLIGFLICSRMMNFHSSMRLSGSMLVFTAWMSSTFWTCIALQTCARKLYSSRMNQGQSHCGPSEI